MSTREWRIPVPFGASVSGHPAGGMIVRFQAGRERGTMQALRAALDQIQRAEPALQAGYEAAPIAAPQVPLMVAGGMALPSQPGQPQAQPDFNPLMIAPPSAAPGGVMAPPPVPMANGQFDPVLAKAGGGMSGPTPAFGSGALPQPPIAAPPQVDPALIAQSQAGVYNALPDTPDGKRPVPVSVEWERDENGGYKLDGAGKRIPIVGEVLAPMPQPAILAPPPIPCSKCGRPQAHCVCVTPTVSADEDEDAVIARMTERKRAKDAVKRAEEDKLLAQAAAILKTREPLNAAETTAPSEPLATEYGE